MRLKTLRTTLAALAVAVAAPVAMTPAEARVMLTECERWAWADCEAEYGRGQINDPAFAVCFENKRIDYCGPPPSPGQPFDPWWPLYPCDRPQGCPAEPPPSPNP